MKRNTTTTPNSHYCKTPYRNRTGPKETHPGGGQTRAGRTTHQAKERDGRERDGVEKTSPGLAKRESTGEGMERAMMGVMERLAAEMMRDMVRNVLEDKVSEMATNSKEPPTTKDGPGEVQVEENWRDKAIVQEEIEYPSSKPTRPSSAPRKKGEHCCPNCICGEYGVGYGRAVSAHRKRCNKFQEYEEYPYCVCGRTWNATESHLADRADHKKRCSRNQNMLISVSNKIESMLVCFEKACLEEGRVMLEQDQLKLSELFDFGKQQRCLLCDEKIVGGYQHFEDCPKKKAIIQCFAMGFVNQHMKGCGFPLPFSREHFLGVLGINQRETIEEQEDILYYLDLNMDLHQHLS